MSNTPSNPGLVQCKIAVSPWVGCIGCADNQSPAIAPHTNGLELAAEILSGSRTVTLQVLDLLTTLAAFRVGAFEVNPMVARLTFVFGRFGGVLMSKVIVVLVAVGVKRLLWVVNQFYVGVVCWNSLILVLLYLRPS